MSHHKAEPHTRHHAHITFVEDQTVYTLLSYTPGVGLICRWLAEERTEVRLTEWKALRPVAEPRVLTVPRSSYLGMVERALRVGAGAREFTAEEVEEVYREELQGYDEDDDVFEVPVTALPGWHTGLSGANPANFIQLVEMYRPANDEDCVYDADDLGKD